jgi:hypothetical protein
VVFLAFKSFQFLLQAAHDAEREPYLMHLCRMLGRSEHYARLLALLPSYHLWEQGFTFRLGLPDCVALLGGSMEQTLLVLVWEI